MPSAAITSDKTGETREAPMCNLFCYVLGKYCLYLKDFLSLPRSFVWA